MPPIARTCARDGCDNTFTAARNRKYCSATCANLVVNARQRIYDRTHYIQHKPDQPRTCLYCGQVFWPQHSKHRYCSLRCSRKHYRQLNPKQRTTSVVSRDVP